MAGEAWGCPTCKDGIAEGGNGYNLVQGYGWSIVFMMSMPFLIFFSLGGYFYYEVRKAQRARRVGRAAIDRHAGLGCRHETPVGKRRHPW